jgi:hypothetical protein
MIGYGNIQNLPKYACSKWPFHIFPFLYARIVWLGMAGGGRRAAGGRAHRFPHDKFSFVYRIFTKLGRMIPLWKGKNHVYFGVIMSKVKVTVTIIIIVDNRIVSAR